MTFHDRMNPDSYQSVLVRKGWRDSWHMYGTAICFQVYIAYSDADRMIQ